MQALAESEMNYEEQALSVRTAEDIRRIMEYSQSEIDRAGRRARHELKAFAAGLAVSLARESIQINKMSNYSGASSKDWDVNNLLKRLRNLRRKATAKKAQSTSGGIP